MKTYTIIHRETFRVSFVTHHKLIRLLVTQRRKGETDIEEVREGCNINYGQKHDSILQ